MEAKIKKITTTRLHMKQEQANAPGGGGGGGGGVGGRFKIYVLKHFQAAHQSSWLGIYSGSPTGKVSKLMDGKDL
jgi:hypothetical protein